MANSRPIAMGIARIAYGTVGDGVPASAFTDLPLPTKSSVAFNFQDPKEVRIDVEGSSDPLYVTLVKDSTDYIEFSLPTPSNDVIKEMTGGELDAETDKWSESVETPDINKSFQIELRYVTGNMSVILSLTEKLQLSCLKLPELNSRNCCL